MSEIKTLYEHPRLHQIVRGTNQILVFNDEGFVVMAKTDVGFTLNNLHAVILEFGGRSATLIPLKEDASDDDADRRSRN